MSIRARIQALCRQRRLSWLPSLVATGSRTRTVIVSDEVRSMATHPVGDDLESERFSSARAHLDWFTQNEMVSFALNPRQKDSDAFIARVEPVTARVICLRSFDCRNGIRVFGCFSEQDVFIALTWQFREDIGHQDWGAEIRRCVDCWDDLFPNHRPLYGTTIDAYLSERFQPA